MSTLLTKVACIFAFHGFAVHAPLVVEARDTTAGVVALFSYCVCAVAWYVDFCSPRLDSCEKESVVVDPFEVRTLVFGEKLLENSVEYFFAAVKGLTRVLRCVLLCGRTGMEY